MAKYNSFKVKPKITTSVKSKPIYTPIKSKPLFKGLLPLASMFAGIVLRYKAAFRYLITSPIRQIKSINLSSFKSKNGFVYRLLLVAMVVSSTILMPLLSVDYGISWDEKIQRDYGKDIIKYYASGRQDTALFDQTQHLYNTMLYYGCSFDVLTGLVHDKILPQTDEFELRHFINALFGVFMMLYTALIARYLGSWRTACIAFVFCILSPSLFGHAMNNPKDIPFAASYIFAIYFMLRLLKQMPFPHIKNITFLTIGIGWTMSTRAGGIIISAFLGLFLAILFFYKIKKIGFNKYFKYINRYALYFLIISIFGYLLGLIIWPFGQRDIIHNPYIALKGLTNVNYLHTYENYNGFRMYMSNVPWHYIFKWIAIGSPLFILVGCVIAFVCVKGVAKLYNYYFILILIFVFLFPICYIVYKNSMIYNGWRHFLFVYLSLVIVAAIGWEYLSCYVSNKWVRWTSITFAVLFCGNVCFWMVKNHPYQYIYFNELVGGTQGAKGNYEMDYYSNSIKEAVKWLIVNEKLQHKNVKVVSNNELLTLTNITEKLTDSVKVLWTRDYERYKQDWDYAIFTTRTYSPSQLKNGHFPPKGTIHTIDVDGVPICAIVKRPHKLVSQGYTLSNKLQYAEAFPYYQQAIELDSTDEEAFRMGGLCLLNLGKEEAALEYINKSVALNPEGFMSYYLKAFYYLGKNDDENAEKLFKLSIKNRINNGDAHAELGNIYLQRGLISMALNSYKNAVEFGNSSPRLFTNMGIAYYNLNDNDSAIKMLNIALNKDPNYLPAYKSMIECFERIGDMQTVQLIQARMKEIQ